MKGNTMRIVVVGDQSVGKTSLICAIISDLATEVPKTHKKVVLPPDMCAYSKDIFTELVDTSASSDLRQEIKQSDLVLLVYDVSCPESVVRLREHWLPIIQSIDREKPVVIAGNKYDKIELPVDQERDYTPVREVLRGLVRSYRQVQMGIECSAAYDRNVKKVLNSAQRAVLYPLGPLYDLTSKHISPKFRKALIRIFRILDNQLTGTLTDSDLSSLQERVFQTELNAEDIRAIKNIIQKQAQEERGGGISVNGFIAFQKKCIEMLKIQICWSILRHFDYNDQLEIKNVGDTFIIRYEEGESLELAPQALNFLHKAYTFAQKTRGEKESPMEKLFQCSPSIPLEEFKREDISLEKFILIWHMFTLLDYRACYRALLYMGYDRKLDECFSVSRSKKTYSDLLKIKERKTYSILFVEDDEHSIYLKGLFQDGHEDGILSRNVIIFSNSNTSKVLNLFKIRDRHLRAFAEENELSHRLDLVVFMTGEKMGRALEVNLCQHVMTKHITREIAEKINLYQLPELDLHSFPITVKHSHLERLLEYLTGIFQRIEQGYSHEFIEHLKSESNQLKKLFFGVASAVTVVAVGFFAFSRKVIK